MSTSFLKKAACVAFAAAALAGLGGCSKLDKALEDSATKTLDNSGYSEIKLSSTFTAAMSCADSDLTGLAFSAKNPAGKSVEGVVCIGSGFKGNTVRF